MSLIGAKAAVLIVALIAVPAAAGAVWAQATPLKGADVMGDKNRSGPDGWVQAPITRDEAPQLKTKAAGEPPSQAASVPPSHKQLNPGDDPGTPIGNPGTGPGKANATPN